MSDNEKRSPTITWAHQLTSGSLSVGNIITGHTVFKNKKMIIAYSLFFLFSALSCHILIQGTGSDHEKKFIEAGLSTINTMGDKISASLLEKDILTLNVAVGELEKKSSPVFTAILDHSDRIIAHSNPDMIGMAYIVPESMALIKKDEGSQVSRSVDPDRGTPVILFSKEIFFSNIKIGKILFGLNAVELDLPLKKYKRFLIVAWGVNILGLVLALILTNYYLKAKLERELREFENSDRLGPYLLQEKIAQGGMAELFRAEYIRGDGFRRTVAIKKILPHLAENQDFIDMFIREARLAASLQHPNIVQIFDLMKIHNFNLIAMEYVHGKNLGEIMDHEKKGLPIGLSIFLIQKISQGLYYSHTRKDSKTNEPLNIVHRDVTPQNMLVSLKGEVKISDFGISKAKSEPSFTQAGVIKGKLSYLSPEIALGKESDHQSDLYALGIIFYEILSGEKVYRFKNELDALRRLPTMEIAPIMEIRPDVSKGLNRIVMKCLEKDKTKRYQSGKEICDDLTALRKQENISYDGSRLVDFMTKRFK